ncbi:hypothetical protein BDV96DRAFT_552293 [Lophiotrema nucula]|uniref:Rhodopsin domain-containing protein n=1 Tax=Lophiotrema nucula TaxID=690887 RepID=A0A6A5YVD4_9PLEO|nr:hypothetical protein BDV96DRAFT_552293 [Lophiotrema nucula]
MASELATAFQCRLERPWHSFGDDASCYDMIAFWRGMSVINMLTDLALILFPVHLIVTLQMSTRKKFTILIFFGARLLDVVASGIQIPYVSAFSSPNPTRDLWKWTLTTQIIECLTILTSCVPYLRPLLDALPSGLYGSDELRRREAVSSLGYSRSKSSTSYKLGSVSTANEERKSRKSQGERGIRRFMPMLSGASTSHSNSASGLPGGPRRPDGEVDVEISAPVIAEDKKWETDSTGSQAKIMKTTEVSTAWEEAQRRSRENSSDEIISDSR